LQDSQSYTEKSCLDKLNGKSKEGRKEGEKGRKERNKGKDIYHMNQVASFMWTEKHVLQHTSYLRNRKLLLITNRNLNLQGLNRGQQELIL
jgi:hypothetical protein